MTDFGKSDADSMRTAADVLDAGGPLPDNIKPLLAGLLRAESQMWEEMQPFVDLLNLVIKDTDGGKSVIRFGRNGETGDIQLVNDNTSNAFRIARAVLNAKESA